MPINDLELSDDLEQYKAVDHDVGTVALMKFQNHLWYLSKHLAGLARFSKTTDAKKKTAILQNLHKKTESPKDLRWLEGKRALTTRWLDLSTLVMKRTLNLFHCLKLSVAKTPKRSRRVCTVAEVCE